MNLIKYKRVYITNVLKHPLFWVGMVLKIALSLFFTSKYLQELFIPFVDYFVDSGFQNPYKHFLAMGQKEAFPYPALMLYIMAMPKLLLGSLTIGPAKLLVYRLPILLADIAILLVLANWLKTRITQVIIIYWLSPVLIYINYVHGQLDALPIAMLFISLHFLFKEFIILSVMCFGAAVATKTSILLALPFFLIYLFRLALTFKDKMMSLVIIAASFIIANLQFTFDSSFIQMVYNNNEQRKIINASFKYSDSLSLYLIPIVYILLVMQCSLLIGRNRNIFIMFLGFAFGIIMLFIAPMPGWYYWIVPFFAYFYSKARLKNTAPLYALQILYLLYFMVINKLYIFKALEVLKIDEDVLAGVIFTALQTALVINCIWIYRQGIKIYEQQKLMLRPFLIGIGGNSGTGKTTLSDALKEVFGSKYATIVKGDDMHKWMRGDDNWSNHTHLNPKANDLHQEYIYLSDLKCGRIIKRRHYDHNTGQFHAEAILKSNEIIVFEGLHPFYIKGVRELFDLRIFIKLDNDIYLHWKTIRDTKKRGYSKEEVMLQIKKREKDYTMHIAPQEKYANILFELCCEDKISNIGDPEENPTLFLKIRCENTVSIEHYCDAIASFSSLHISHNYDMEDYQVLEIHGIPSKECIEIAASKLVAEELEEIGINLSLWEDGCLGLMQLFAIYYILEKEKYKDAR